MKIKNRNYLRYIWTSVICGIKAFTFPIRYLSVISWILLVFVWPISIAIGISWGLGAIFAWPFVKTNRYLPLVTYILSLALFVLWNILIDIFDDPSTKVWAFLYIILYSLVSARTIFLINKEILQDKDIGS